MPEPPGGLIGTHYPAKQPNHIANLGFWYDFSDIRTLYQDTARATPVTADGQLIGSVADKSSIAVHLTRGSGAGTEPVYKANIRNGNSVSRHDGTDDYWLSASNIPAMGASGWVGFAVFSRAGVATGDQIIAVGSNLWACDSATDWLWKYTAGGVAAKVGGAATTGWNIGQFASLGTGTGSAKVWLNGGQPGLGNNAGMTFSDGSGQLHVAEGGGAPPASPFFGDIGELIFYNRYLSDEEQGNISVYLAQKWNVSHTSW